MLHIRVEFYKDSRDPFIQMLDQEGVDFGEIHMFSASPMAANISAIAIHLAAASPLIAALSAVIVAWIKSKSSRKVIVTTKDRTDIHLEGLSTDEVIKILSSVENMAVIDTERAPVCSTSLKQ